MDLLQYLWNIKVEPTPTILVLYKKYFHRALYISWWDCLDIFLWEIEWKDRTSFKYFLLFSINEGSFLAINYTYSFLVSLFVSDELFKSHHLAIEVLLFKGFWSRTWWIFDQQIWLSIINQSLKRLSQKLIILNGFFRARRRCMIKLKIQKTSKHRSENLLSFL